MNGRWFGVLPLLLAFFPLAVAVAEGGPDGPAARLADETSPYLQHHADNAVAWHPWGEEAFSRARDEDKPIFLSIGYSACHWCHVMEEESFTNPDVAAILNEHFISVLVDREERPDLDSLYMTAASLIGGRGGWPLNVIMTPDRQPFFTATYMPRETRGNQVGMLDLLPGIAQVWDTRRDDVITMVSQVNSILERVQDAGSGGEPPGDEAVRAAVSTLASSFDPDTGGFGGGPRFPQPGAIIFLLRYASRTGDRESLAMAERTLQAIRYGGIYDQVGFGVHRYAVDANWLTPHFEKMLYDQALLTLAFVEAWEQTGRELYRDTAEEILNYVGRKMTSRRGVFFTSEDADTTEGEGVYYTWDHDEFLSTAGENGELLARMFGVTPEGNFVDEATGHSLPLNILHLSMEAGQFAAENGVTAADIASGWDDARVRLLAERERRSAPFRDEKVLTDWNGLMIAAYARAGSAFNNPEYVETARRAFEHILDKARLPGGGLAHLLLDGDASVPAMLDDYAFLLWGALELYGATYDPGVLENAVGLARTILANFADEERGGFYMTAADVETVLVRQRSSLDRGIPSGNSSVMLSFARLSRLTGLTEFADAAWRSAGAFAVFVESVPESHTHMLTAVEFLSHPSFEVVIVGEPDAPDTREMLSRLRSLHVPGMVILLKEPGDDTLSGIAPFTRYHSMIGGRATAFVCEDFACNLPTNDPDEMVALITGGGTAGAGE